MAPRNTHIVFGFGSCLDWRSTAFVNAIPAIRSCTACELVPSTAALLPCRHGLCPSCFERCTDGECGHCPVDKQRFQSGDIVWSTFEKDALLSREIHCWNADHGCDAVGAAPEILEHFNHQCQYHVVSCPRCAQYVAHKDIISHLDSGSCFVAAEQSKRAQDRHSNVSVVPVESIQSFENTLKEISEMSRAVLANISEIRVAEESNAGAIKTQLRELQETQARICEEKSRETTAALVTITDTLYALSYEHAAGIVNVKDRLQKLEVLTGQCKTLGRTSGEALVDMKAEFNEKLNNLEATSQAIFPDLRRESRPLEWTISGWSNLKEKARREKTAISAAKNPAYFHGYCVLPAMMIETSDGVQWFRLVYWIHKGAYDHLLSWPIKERFFFKVVKPTGECLQICIVSDTSLDDLECVKRPKTQKNDYMRAPGKIKLEKIEESGYITDDKVRVRFQVK
ncbi:uncharacterized protein LOC144178045 [Haemaphysalis longicornis]